VKSTGQTPEDSDNRSLAAERPPPRDTDAVDELLSADVAFDGIYEEKITDLRRRRLR
jgi:hypothetical protein